MMTNVEIKKHGIFDKGRKDKRENAYQTIGGSRSSMESSTNQPAQEKPKVSNDGLSLNPPVNLKKSKTFKIIVNKKGKEKDKSVLKKDKTKIKNKKRKRSDVKIEDTVLESETMREFTQHLFGVSLTEACKYSKSHDGYPLPAFFRICIDYLEAENRLSFEGIYRIPGVNSQIAKLKQTLNTEVDIADLLLNYDIAVVTSIVKSFLRDLKPDIVSRNLELLLFKSLEKYKDNVHEKVSVVKNLIREQLPQENQYLLALVINHMAKIIDMSHQNKMTLENLLIVLSPTLHLHFELLKFFYDHSSALFMDQQVPVYVPPIRPEPGHEEDLPETVDGINEELKKQISYLDDLHEQINQGFGTEKIEYLIWEVQLIVTKLKRKKYIAELNDPELIKNELKKYERQLKRLHKDMLDISTNSATANSTGGSITAAPVTGTTDPITVGAPSSLDQELWQVQRTITTLNRKLKVLTSTTKTSSDHVVPVATVYSKIDNCNDDDDDDSVQLNLTLRKLPVDSIESLDDEGKNEPVAEQSSTNDSGPDDNITNEVVQHAELHQSIDERPTDWPTVQEAQTVANSNDRSFEDLNVSETYLNVFHVDNDNSTSSNGAINTTVTEDYPGSNSESQMTGSNMATNIDDLIQTGEIWTNEKDELLPEDEDCRNEALRYLYMREELISIRNDLKTRISSEYNEIVRLKKNIEELDEERAEKNFRAQNQYRKLHESCSSTDDKQMSGKVGNGGKEGQEDEAEEDEEDRNDTSSDEEDECDLETSSGDSDSVQYGEQRTLGSSMVRRPVPVGSHDDGSHNGDLSGLVAQHRDIVLDNDRLEKENMDLLDQIQLERNHCVDLKVALRTHMLLTCSSPWPCNMDE